MEFNHKKLPSYFMVGTIFFVVIWFNIQYFKNRISSNAQSISEYALSDDDIAPWADVAVAGIFYPAEVYQTDNDKDGHIEEIRSVSYCPRIMIEPHYGLRRAAEVAAESYGKVSSCANRIKKVFILAPVHTPFKGAALSRDNSIKTPLGEVNYNQSIIAEIKNKKHFSLSQSIYGQENLWQVQLPYLQKVLPSFKIIPILYGDIPAEELASLLKNYIAKEDSLLIISADLGKYQKKNPGDKAAIEDIHEHCGDTGVAAAMILAQELGLVPQFLESVANVNYEPPVSAKGWSYETVAEKKILYGLDLYYSHVQNFVRHHKKELIAVADNCLRDNYNKRCKIKRKHYNDYLFNRGASFVTLSYKGKVLSASGSIVPSKAVAADIADNVHKAVSLLDKKVLPLDKIKISIQLLTDWEKVRFNSYGEALRKIRAGTDGIVIRSGDREGFLLPQEWQKFKNKEEFMTELKIRAGLSPNYWNDDIKIFKFRTVEVK